jgi:hypothetical protein
LVGGTLESCPSIAVKPVHLDERSGGLTTFPLGNSKAAKLEGAGEFFDASCV